MKHDPNIRASTGPRRLIVTGGRQRAGAASVGDFAFEEARLLVIDVSTGTVEREFTYETPPQLRAGETTMRFGAGGIEGDRIIVPLATEVLEFSLPSFKRTRAWSHPLMNAVHHAFAHDGGVLVASTGLDCVIDLDAGGALRQCADLGNGAIRSRFPQVEDFRKLVSAKPHSCHINYVFKFANEIFATRFVQRDAISLSDPDRRFIIETGGPHDGVVYGDRVHFTTVDGHICIYEGATRQLVRRLRLAAGSDSEREPLGWCRGLLIQSDELAWVGFSRLRPTHLQANLQWLRGRVPWLGTSGERPTRIALCDLRNGQMLSEIDVERFGLSGVYSIMPMPEKG